MTNFHAYLLQANPPHAETPPPVEALEPNEHLAQEHTESTEAGQAAHGPTEHAPVDLATQLNTTNTIAFFVVVVFLAWVFKKFGVLGLFGRRKTQVEEEVRKLEAEKQQALAELEAIKKRTAGLQSEVDDILSKAQSSAESMSRQILAEAGAQAEKVVEAAGKRIELEQRAAARDLEKRLLNDALADAREELARNLSADDQKRSVEDFLANLKDRKETLSR